MKIISFKHYLCSLICLICIGSLSLTLFASSTSTIDMQLTSSISDLKDIENQVVNSAKTIYINKLNNKANDANQSSLDLYSQKVTQIRSNLAQLNNDTTLNKAQKTKTSTLIATASYMLFLIENLGDYIHSTDPMEQFDLLSTHFQVLSLITQIFSYVE